MSMGGLVKPCGADLAREHTDVLPSYEYELI